MSRFLLFTLLIFFLVYVPHQAKGQLHVAPPAVYLSDQQPSGRLEVLNTGRHPVKVTVDLGYGYPRTNADGQIYMKLFDRIPVGEPTADDWIQIYPHRFTLNPGLRQTIRFAVFAPASVEPREYWARPIVSARIDRPTELSAKDGLQANLQVVQRSILALNYRHGQVHTAPILDSLQVRQDQGSLKVQSYIRQTGTAASLGNLVVKITDPENERVVHRKERQVAVYHKLNRMIQWPISSLEKSRYRITVELNSQRKGPRPGDILPFKTIRKSQLIDIEQLKKL